MKRREVVKGALLAGSLAVLGLPQAQAQEAGAFVKTKRDVPRSTPGKIDVVEFFWYGCPHCFHFEPALNEWIKKLPGDVHFMKVPVRWPSNRVNFEGHQKLYFTLEALGKMPAAHAKVFDAMHKDKNPLANDNQIFDFAVSIGLNREEFANMYKSFAVSTKCAKATSLMEAYGPDGVPTLGIDGKFMTSASIAGTEENALRVADLLIKRARQG
ncbi:thiol:disulfide interchange protein DsbA/DsbL [Limnobacter humi]|uniref:Thiol:disulfide interchange protein n=1 Tax=Limnobacter humi TaxID=1778671 RepID=A0ABT1WCY1_9BURK|nr:thiol:disulfide interchange protein DsbA/DsbL [Limnobacter humi]MCQ8895383.1 thiol:disulfide interchange protein DsbA/DsbL [Limnobacter humi]